MYAVLRAVKYMYYYGTLLGIQISTATEMLKKKKRIASQDEASKRRKISRTNCTECGLSFWRWPMTLMCL